MTAPELKPCPFCGGKPYLANVEMVGCAYVVCTDCRMQSDDMSKERAIAAWNTRTNTIPDPLDDPRVVTLVGAAQYMVIQAEWRESNEGVFWEATDLMRSALAALKGGA